MISNYQDFRLWIITLRVIAFWYNAALYMQATMQNSSDKYVFNKTGDNFNQWLALALVKLGLISPTSLSKSFYPV